uniref:Reverse transcriptase domain-containing protein n=1 Tax=Trichuris muris TaxID=70415 RepID=A0A5S6R5A3_TRIMR
MWIKRLWPTSSSGPHYSIKSVFSILVPVYVIQQARNLEVTCFKLTNLKCKLSFLVACRDTGLLPNFLRLKWEYIRNSNVARVLWNAGVLLLRLTIRDHRRNIAVLTSQIGLLVQNLRSLGERHMNVLHEHISLLQYATYCNKMTTLEKKFTDLICERNWCFVNSHRRTTPQKEAVVNLSGLPLSDMETSLLQKGLNFVPTPRSVKYLNIISDIEDSLQKVEGNVAVEFKGALANLLTEHVYRPRNNLTYRERRTLKELKARDDIVITKADKGNVTVVLAKDEYVNKVNRLLSEDSYQAIDGDPTELCRSSLLQLLTSFIEETKDDDLQKIARWLRFSNEVISPELYCLPKIHKPEVPFRPVVSSTNSVTSKLARFLSKVIQPLTGQRSSHVANSIHFRTDLKRVNLEADDIMVSYDVKDLFTSIPVEHTLQLTLNLLEHDVNLTNRTKLNPFHLIQLIKFCLTDGNYFHFQRRFFRQSKGVPMGSPLSPVFAEIFMENLEDNAFSTVNLQYQPKFFKRYVDDIFVLIKKGNEEKFLKHLNSLFRNVIIFTMEKEKGNMLPFLDVQIMRRNNSLKTTVYRKPTDSGLFLNYTSHHPKSVFFGIVNGMVKRALELCDEEFLHHELKHIERVLCQNGYPRNLVRSANLDLLRLLLAPLLLLIITTVWGKR